MATNPPSGDGYRDGAVGSRSQFLSQNRKVKLDKDTGRFIDVK